MLGRFYQKQGEVFIKSRERFFIRGKRSFSQKHEKVFIRIRERFYQKQGEVLSEAGWGFIRSRVRFYQKWKRLLTSPFDCNIFCCQVSDCLHVVVVVAPVDLKAVFPGKEVQVYQCWEQSTFCQSSTWAYNIHIFLSCQGVCSLSPLDIYNVVQHLILQ